METFRLHKRLNSLAFGWAAEQSERQTHTYIQTDQCFCSVAQARLSSDAQTAYLIPRPYTTQPSPARVSFIGRLSSSAETPVGWFLSGMRAHYHSTCRNAGAATSSRAGAALSTQSRACNLRRRKRQRVAYATGDRIHKQRKGRRPARTRKANTMTEKNGGGGGRTHALCIGAGKCQTALRENNAAARNWRAKRSFIGGCAVLLKLQRSALRKCHFPP